MSATEEWEPSDDFEPVTAIMQALVAKTEGKPYNEDEFVFAVCLLATANLMRNGLDADTAMAAVEQAMKSGNIHASYSEAEGLSVTIGEGAGEEDAAVA